MFALSAGPPNYASIPSLSMPEIRQVTTISCNMTRSWANSSSVTISVRRVFVVLCGDLDDLVRTRPRVIQDICAQGQSCCFASHHFFSESILFTIHT